MNFVSLFILFTFLLSFNIQANRYSRPSVIDIDSDSAIDYNKNWRSLAKDNSKAVDKLVSLLEKSKTGKQLVAVQNNLLNLGNAKDNDPTDVDFMAKLNAHTVTVHDLADSKRLATIDFKQRYNKGIDNIDSLFGSGFTHHH